MSDELLVSLRSNGPVSPAVQMRHLLVFGRDRGWTFEAAWKWSFERVKWPHDTGHRKEWKAILGESHDDPARWPSQQRVMWRSSYERSEASRAEESVGRLLIAA